jgi:voltage-gated potassium channel
MLLDHDLRLIDAMYMVTITLSTVGYRESVRQTPANQAWTMILVMFGSLTAAAVIASLAGVLVTGDIGRLIGSRKLEARIKLLREHTIVCGFGRMGQQLVERLKELDVPLVVVEREPARIAELQQRGCLHVVGDATDEGVLERAGLGQARSLVAALAGDADNLFVTLSGRQQRPDLYIVARAENPSTEAKLRRAGANRVISLPSIAANWAANVLTRPHVADFVAMATGGVELEMSEVKVAAESPLAGKSLRQSDFRKLTDLIVVAIRGSDGVTRFNPGPEELVQPGDLLVTIGKAGAASRLSSLR